MMGFDLAPAVIGIAPGDRATLIASGEFTAYYPSLEPGAIFEVYAGRLVFRTDVGDTIVWHRPEPRNLNPRFLRHNLQAGSGIAVRLGPRLRKGYD